MNNRSSKPVGSLFVLFMILQGCSSYSKPDYGSLNLVEVSGSVSLDGTPLPNAEIRFETESDQIYSYGITDATGKYRLMFDSRTPGIIPGPKIVRVFTKPSASEKTVSQTKNTEYHETEDGESNRGEEQEGADTDESLPQPTGLPESYGKNSKIRVEVTGPEKNFDFDLRSDGTTTARKMS